MFLLIAGRERRSIVVSRLLAFTDRKCSDAPLMDFEVIGEIRNVEPIAKGTGVHDRTRLRKHYGRGRWRKLKGFASVRLTDGTVHTAELHWYEAHGVGRKEFKIKFPLLD